MYFHDRSEAGRQMVRLVQQYGGDHPVVIGIPNGGIATAAEVAEGLGAPLELWAAARIPAPEQPELGLGAVAEGGFVHLDRRANHWPGTSPAEIQALVSRKKVQVAETARRLRGGRPSPQVQDRTVILVDDGVAHGGTAHAVLEAIRAARPRRLVLTVPVGAISTLAELRRVADNVHALEETRNLVAVGAWFEDFPRIPDPEVAALLDPLKARAVAASEQLPANHREIDVRLDGATITGSLCVPPGARGLVISAHASGSGRFAPRNRFVAAELRKRGLATLLVDLLTHREELRDFQTGELRYDIELLARRLVAVTEWATHAPDTRRMKIGYLGSATAAAAEITAAARRPLAVAAAVARGGRPDLAQSYLGRVKAATLLIAGNRDESGRIELARESLVHESDLQIVPGATALFEEPGALERVCELAGDWFDRFLLEHEPPPRG